MPFQLVFNQVWSWIADTGINLALLIILAMLVPRAGRLANRIVEKRIQASQDEDEGKSSLAIAGVGIYIIQIIAYFLILVFLLQQIGFSLAGAAIPATVISAAVGFGSQQIIADFVAGFFILSEKQYGVGDLVTFQGNGVDLTGTVIQITMRSTQVRTLEEYTVTIPNSAAQVCINNSNHWSRALVVVPVPLLGSRDTEEVIARADSAPRRAIADPEIEPLIRGELLSQPGLNLNAPTTVGMPWTLDIRYMIRCSPGDQFPIERAINVYVLEEFFDEYGSATPVSGETTDDPDNPKTSAFAPAFASKRYASDWGLEGAEEAHTTVIPANRTGITAGDTEIPEADNDPAAQDQTQRRHALGTLGGRVRASTGALITAFIVLLIFRGLTMSAAEDSEARSGVLAPPRVNPTSTVPEESTTPTETKQPPTTEQTPATEQTQAPTSEQQQQRQNQQQPEQQPATTPAQQPTQQQPSEAPSQPTGAPQEAEQTEQTQN